MVVIVVMVVAWFGVLVVELGVVVLFVDVVFELAVVASLEHVLI